MCLSPSRTPTVLGPPRAAYLAGPISPTLLSFLPYSFDLQFTPPSHSFDLQFTLIIIIHESYELIYISFYRFSISKCESTTVEKMSLLTFFEITNLYLHRLILQHCKLYRKKLQVQFTINIMSLKTKIKEKITGIILNLLISCCFCFYKNVSIKIHKIFLLINQTVKYLRQTVLLIYLIWENLVNFCIICT